MRTLHDFLSDKVKFMHTSPTTRSHSCSEKTTRTPHVHLVFVHIRTHLVVVTRNVCPSVRPSSVEITLERSSSRSAEPIDKKISLDIGS